MLEFEYQYLTDKELGKALTKLYRSFPKLLTNIRFGKGQQECICGTISKEITRFLRKNGLDAHFMDGIYIGRGTEFSGGKQTYHCWVELWVSLQYKETNWYELKEKEKEKEFKIIIDGAYAQFFPFAFTPQIVRDKLRLMIFINDKIAESWYSKGKEDLDIRTQYPLERK